MHQIYQMSYVLKRELDKLRELEESTTKDIPKHKWIVEDRLLGHGVECLVTIHGIGADLEIFYDDEPLTEQSFQEMLNKIKEWQEVAR